MSKGLIDVTDREIYEYATTVLCYLIAPLFIITFLIPVTKISYEGYMMIIPFILLRRQCGGFHFKNSTICFVVSIAYLLLLEVIGNNIKQSPELLLFSLFCLGYLLYKAIKNSITDKSGFVFKHNFRIIVICVLLVIALLLFFSIDSSVCGKWICIGIIMTFILQIPDIIKTFVSRSAKVNEKRLMHSKMSFQTIIGRFHATKDDL